MQPLDLTKKRRWLLEQAEQLKASERAKVGRSFDLVKDPSRHRKEVAEIRAQLYSLFGLASLVIAERSL